jgi:FAD/FMN-containing dehydrogenase
VFEGQLGHWGLNELLGLDVVDGDGEIWNTTHDQQEVTAARERHC